MDQQNQQAPAASVDVVTGAPQAAPAEQVVARQEAQTVSLGADGGNSIAGASLNAGSGAQQISLEELQASREKYEAEHRAFVRKQELKQGAFLIMASIIAAEPNANLANAADRAYGASVAVLDRLERD